MSFSNASGIVCAVITTQFDKVKTHLEHQPWEFWEHPAMTHMHASRVSSFIICTVPTVPTITAFSKVLYCTYIPRRMPEVSSLCQRHPLPYYVRNQYKSSRYRGFLQYVHTISLTVLLQRVDTTSDQHCSHGICCILF